MFYSPRIVGIRWPSMPSLLNICCFLSSLFPKVLCTSILTWSIFVITNEVSYEIFVLKRGHTSLGPLVGLIAVVLFALCIYTYYKVIFLGPGSPLDFDELMIKDIRSFDKRYRSENPYDAEEPDRPLLQNERETPPAGITFHLLNGGSQRYCSKCRAWKPDRCHHCSKCQRCNLRMDHHCPWFATCIGFYNHKFFVQFLGYITVYTGYVFLTCLVVVWQFFLDDDYMSDIVPLQVVFLLIIALAFWVSTGAFFWFLLWLTFKNITTIEFQESSVPHRSNFGPNYHYGQDGKRQKLGNIYDLGWRQNLTSIMGNTWEDYILPTTVTDRRFLQGANNGINFNINEVNFQEWQDSINLQNNLDNQLRSYQERVRHER